MIYGIAMEYLPHEFEGATTTLAHRRARATYIDLSGGQKPNRSGLIRRAYTLRGIKGIGVVESSLSIEPSTGFRGGYLTNAHTEERELVLTLGFLPDPFSGETITDLRNHLHRIAPNEGNVRVTFYTTHMGTVYCEGYVETHESNITTEDPMSQITILCPDPDFISEERKVIDSEQDLTTYNYIYFQDDYEYKGTASTPVELEFTLPPNVLATNSYVTIGTGHLTTSIWPERSSPIRIQTPYVSDVFTNRNQPVRVEMSSEYQNKKLAMVEVSEDISHNVLPFVRFIPGWFYLTPTTHRLWFTVSYRNTDINTSVDYKVAYSERYISL